MSSRRHIIVLVLLLWAPLPVAAAPGLEIKAEEEGADFWGDIADPGRRRFVAALKRGKAYYRSATTSPRHLSPALLEQLLRDRTRRSPGQLRLGAMKSALASFQAAVKVSPQRAEGRLWLGKALYMLAHMASDGGVEGPHHDASLMTRAGASFTRARELSPALLEDYEVALDMAIIHSSQGRLKPAVMEYERAERIVAASQSSSREKRKRRARVQGNAAECLMGLGRLEEAIQRYQEALTMRYDAVVNHWGLAVALDRDEQQGKALYHARRAMSRDRTMKALTSPDIFFVPDGEVHYYFAVGRLAQGKPELARKSFEAFLAKLPRSQWAPRARAHLAQLGSAGAEPQRKPVKGLAPKPGQTGADLAARDRSRYRLRVGARLSRVRRCYVEQLKKKSSLTGRVKVGFRVGKKGKASRLKVKHSTIQSPGLRRCLFKVIKAINFQRPTSAKVIDLEYIFDFRPLR